MLRDIKIFQLKKVKIYEKLDDFFINNNNLLFSILFLSYYYNRIKKKYP